MTRLRRLPKRRDPSRADSRITWGVYPHAFWKVTEHRTGDGHPELTGRGYVVREVSPGVPYGRMTPVRTFKLKRAADKLADKMTETEPSKRDPSLRRRPKTRRDPDPGERFVEYRGFRITKFEGLSSRPATLAGLRRGEMSGGSRKERGYAVHYPDGGAKILPTLKRAREYVDNYIG